jgi:hypothetical protein
MTSIFDNLPAVKITGKCPGPGNAGSFRQGLIVLLFRQAKSRSCKETNSYSFKLPLYNNI